MASNSQKRLPEGSDISFNILTLGFLKGSSTVLYNMHSTMLTRLRQKDGLGPLSSAIPTVALLSISRSSLSPSLSNRPTYTVGGWSVLCTQYPGVGTTFVLTFQLE